MNVNEVEIKSIIQDLKLMNEGVGVDGETMQYILQQTGMEWQMLRQLMLTMPIEQVDLSVVFVLSVVQPLHHRLFRVPLQQLPFYFRLK